MSRKLEPLTPCLYCRCTAVSGRIVNKTLSSKTLFIFLYSTLPGFPKKHDTS